MSYIQFNKAQLVNLSYSLSKEYLRANQFGTYASSTIIQCNTRKYHGLLVAPQPHIDNEWHVLLSCIDPTIVQQGQAFHLGIHKYPNKYHPLGHKYIEDYMTEPIPKITYRVGSIVLSREVILIHQEDRVILKYTLVESPEPIQLELQPFLAFRGRHSLSKCNTFLNRRYTEVENGVSWRLYENYTDLAIQFSKPANYVPAPDWYYNIEYIEEKARGYECLEDLYVPGHFEVTMKAGESILVSAGTTAVAPRLLTKKFNTELARRTPRNDFRNCLTNAARQFVIERDGRGEIVAGFPWFGAWGRDTFIALPGIALAYDSHKLFTEVLETMISDMKGALFTNTGINGAPAYNTADASLWFFWTLQQYQQLFGIDSKTVWKKYGTVIKAILQGYKAGEAFGIQMRPNGLIWQGAEGFALTWMDAVVDGKPVTPRAGYAVDICALWYNAVCYALSLVEMAKETKKEKAFVDEFNTLPALIKTSFVETFWSEEKQYLADLAYEGYRDLSVRPNQVFACSLPFSPLTDEQQHGVLERIKSELLTPRGLRSLTPKNPFYIGTYEGDQTARDRAYHQGTVWAWLTGAFAEAYLKLYGESGRAFIEDLVRGFEPTMLEAGISTISEIYDGDPPHAPRGAISQAWSVAELIRVMALLETPIKP